MDSSIDLVKTLAPEVIDLVEKRYTILRAVSYNQPIGRRGLSDKVGMQERSVRNEATILKDQGLLDIDSMGMNITSDGMEVIDKLSSLYMDLKGIPELEKRLAEVLGIKKVYIVPGTSSEDEMTLKDMGKLASRVLKSKLDSNDIIGITGGSTMASVANECISDNKYRNITVIPARGGLGKDIYTQSNSIAVNLAEKLGGAYKLLYVPDGLSEEALKHMIKNEEISESIKFLENMNTLVFGIGRGDIMAKRRNFPKAKIDELLEKGVVAEAFGHYFDIKGNEIWEYKTIGLSLDKFEKIDKAIGVAGGEEKAQAIIAISTLNKQMELVTDELAAKKILEIHGLM